MVHDMTDAGAVGLPSITWLCFYCACLQAGHLRLLRLDVWEIPSLPQMAHLKHLMICKQTGKTDGCTDDTMSSVFACLQHLTELETLDLKLINTRAR